MLCQRCNQREANMYLKKVVNGVKQEFTLCNECAKEVELGSKNGYGGFGIEDFITNFMYPSYGAFSPPKASPPTTCPHCGMTLPEFKRGGRLGCKNCYDEFDSYLENFFKNVNSEAKHRGRLPNGMQETVELKDKLSDLKQRLTEAISKEEFELAARLRDEIKEIQNEAGGE